MSESGETLMRSLRAILAASPGALPPADAIDRLGGWQRVANDLPSTLEDPESVILVRIVARDAADGGEDAATAMPAIADAVLAMESPAGLAESLDALLGSAAVLDAVSDQLVERLLELVTTFTSLGEPSARDVSRTATALEAVTRVTIGGYGSQFGLLAALERFRAPVPKRLAAAVVRSVGTAVDYWPAATSLTKVVESLAGLAAPTTTQIASADPEDVASDASWVLANIELVQALRADSQTTMLEHLDNSLTYLLLGTETYDRDDARVLVPVVQTVHTLIRVGPDFAALEAALPSQTDIERLVEQQAQFNLALSGLDHWYADVKRRTTAAWVMLLDDLGRARALISQEAFYRPEAAIEDLLEMYRAARSVEVVRRVDDLGGVLSVIQPVIESGFASRAAFVANLDTYTHELAVRLRTIEGKQHALMFEQHEVATQVLAEARSVMTRGESSGKDAGGTAITLVPPQLEQLFGSDTEALAKLAEFGPDIIARLAAAVENTATARRPSLQESGILRNLAVALSASPDYDGVVKAAVDELVLQIVRFVENRQNAQKNRKPYLFDSEADEGDLHEDLYDYLWSALGRAVDIEVPQIGGGRADLRITYAAFSVYLELKVDDTMKPLSEKGAYLKQAVTYQATDVRIGFVIALRTRAFPQANAHPHLTSLFTHATVEVTGDDQVRHLVLVDVPGNRSSPAAKKANV